jgi:hypothetical protein
MDTCHECVVTEWCLLHYPVDLHNEIKKTKHAIWHVNGTEIFCIWYTE